MSDDDEYANTSEDERKERNRRARAIDKASRPGRKAPPPPKLNQTSVELHGDWPNRPINTVADWEGIAAAAKNGDDYALRYIMYLNTRHQMEGRLGRSAGIAALLSGFNGLIKSAPVESRYASLKSKGRTNNPTSFPSGLPPNNPGNHSSGSGQPNPDNAALVGSGQNSTAKTGDKSRKKTRPGPSDDLDQHVRYWSHVSMPSWPAGLRLAIGRLPSSSDFGFAEPHREDLQALRFMYETQPIRRHDDVATKRARRNYRDQFVRLFSIFGLYRSIVEQFQSNRGSRIRAPFPFDTRNLELHQVALWLHDHGLAFDSNELENIERWASDERLRSDSQSAEGDWSSPPHSLNSYAVENSTILEQLPVEFRYPPAAFIRGRVRSSTEMETFVHANRLRAHLTPFEDRVSTEDEPEDVVMTDNTPPTTQPGDSNGKVAQAKGPA